MSNTIRPKVNEAINQIASSDSTGKSKSKVDTQKEFQALQDYLSGNYDELTTIEKNSIQTLLDNAKDYLKNTLGNKNQVNEKDPKSMGDYDQLDDGTVDNESNTNGTGVATASDEHPPKDMGDYGDVDEATGDNEPNTNGTGVATANGEHPKSIGGYGEEDGATVDNESNTNGTGVANANGEHPKSIGGYGDEDDATGDNELNDGDDFSTEEKNSKDMNAYQQGRAPGKKVTHNGKMCIEMPNGHLYDMQGRRIK